MGSEKSSLIYTSLFPRSPPLIHPTSSTQQNANKKPQIHGCVQSPRRGTWWGGRCGCGWGGGEEGGGEEGVGGGEKEGGGRGGYEGVELVSLLVFYLFAFSPHQPPRLPPGISPSPTSIIIHQHSIISFQSTRQGQIAIFLLTAFTFLFGESTYSLQMNSSTKGTKFAKDSMLAKIMSLNDFDDFDDFNNRDNGTFIGYQAAGDFRMYASHFMILSMRSFNRRPRSHSGKNENTRNVCSDAMV